MKRPSDLEHAILQEYRKRYKYYGFPKALVFDVLSRHNFGSGRSTKLNHIGKINSPDGSLYLADYSHLEVGNVVAGATLFINICDRKATKPVILINVEEQWDGDETTCSILNPETADFSVRGQ
ncbi:hypothetical protein [Sulfitobacter sp. MF3-043]|uniref:hypothetical protein n=1 Tax=Sulfitobacter sediminivivens TaxID=3252902 RepID=UPI0036DB820F